MQNCNQNIWISETLVTIDDRTLKNNPYFENYFIANKTTFWFSIMTDEVNQTCMPIMCLIDGLTLVATHHLVDLDLFTF